VAGYETTSTALSFCSYLLATNPDKQELLFEEIDENVRENVWATILHILVIELTTLSLLS
jgi:cytochrome P450